MKFYALRNKKTGKIMSADAYSNGDSEFCYDIRFELEEPTKIIDENIWFSSSREAAEAVVKESTPWYNASRQTPDYSSELKGKLEVVEIELTVKG